MSFHKGDVVSIGSGKVHYTVEYDETAGMIHITSNNTGRSQAIDPARLKLVTAARNAEHASEDAINAALDSGANDTVDEIMELLDGNAWGTDRTDKENDEFMLSIDGPCELTDEQIESLDETYAESGMTAAQAEKEKYLSEFRARPTPYNAFEDYEEWNSTETIPSDPYTAEEISVLFPGAKYALHIDGMSHGYRSFGAACDALVIAQRGEFGTAAIDCDGVRKVTRQFAR